MLERRFWMLIANATVAAGLVAAAGCADQGATARTKEEPAVAEQSAPAPAEVARDQATEMKGHRMGGPERLLGTALHELDLEGAQRSTLEGAMKDLHAAGDAPMRAVFSTLADGVRANRIDATALDAKLAALDASAPAHRASSTRALQTLHDTLTPEQRAELVAAIGERKGHSCKGGKAHDQAGAEKDHADKAGWRKHKGPLAHLLRGLDLRDDQRDKLSSELSALRDEGPAKDGAATRGQKGGAQPAGIDEKAKAMLESFATDRFDAKAFVPEGAEAPRAHLERAVKVIEAMLPVLDQDQRAKLADNLLEGPASPNGAEKHGRRHRAEAPEGTSPRDPAAPVD